MRVAAGNVARCSSKSDELRNINSIGFRARNIAIEKLRIEILVKTMSLEIDKCKSKNEVSVTEVL